MCSERRAIEDGWLVVRDDGEVEGAVGDAFDAGAPSQRRDAEAGVGMFLAELVQRAAHQAGGHLLAAGEVDRGGAGGIASLLDKGVQIVETVHQLLDRGPDLEALGGQPPGLPLAHQPRPVEQRAGVLEIFQPFRDRRLVQLRFPHHGRRLSLVADQAHEGLKQLERQGHRSGHETCPRLQSSIMSG